MSAIPPDQNRFGAARRYSEQVLGGPTNETDKTVSLASAGRIVEFNPDRVGLIIVNLGSADLMVAPDSGVSSTFGVRLGANGGNTSLNVTEDFTLVAHDWWGFPLSGTVTVYVIEYVRFSTYNQ